MGPGPATGTTVTARPAVAAPPACDAGGRDHLAPAPTAVETPFARVAVHVDLSQAKAAWAKLEQAAAISGYQTLRWVEAWVETTGSAEGIRPAIVLAHDHDGEPVALLPLGVRKTGPVRRAVFLGGRDANFNLGLFRPQVRWTLAHVRALLAAAASAAPGGIDLFDLRNQPIAWRGVLNPLSCLPRLASPSFGAYGRLQSDADAFFTARTCTDTQKTLRKKARRLIKHFGALEHVTGTSETQVRAILAAFEAQKSARLRALGLPDLFADGSLMAFLSRASLEGLPAAALEVHALRAGTRIVATFGGTAHAGRFSGMFISFDDDVEVARSSPGDQLLRCVVAQKCAAGLDEFDLGVGEALYKSSYCDEVEPLFDAVVSVTLVGNAFAAALRSRQRLKRFAKQTPWAWAMVRSARKGLSRLRR